MLRASTRILIVCCTVCEAAGREDEKRCENEQIAASPLRGDRERHVDPNRTELLL